MVVRFSQLLRLPRLMPVCQELFPDMDSILADGIDDEEIGGTAD